VVEWRAEGSVDDHRPATAFCARRLPYRLDRSGAGNLAVDFVRDGVGRITSLVLHQNGQDIKAPKK
jgi:hypothetical protein